MAINWRDAPPPTAVDGLLAVPVDVSSLTAAVVLDGSTSTATADATLSYTVGPHDGHPLFDLRQSVDECWLDGVAIDPSSIAARDVGAGAFGSVRVVAHHQLAGTDHTLRVTYGLAAPQSELGGSYPPALVWSAGPRVQWSWGMSDLYAGRYLEAWLPANLQFDQFPVSLVLQVTGTLAEHSLITNGAVTALGAGRWQVAFPGWYSSLSPLLELRPSNTVESATGSVTLPVSGTTCSLEAWKLAGGPDDLTARLTQLRQFLIANEAKFGPMLGNRFVLFFNGGSGGMEYAGATTTSSSAMGHEVFHSWFARGIAPAGQADGWWDEGFTVWHDGGADDIEPFDFLDPPVTLCSRQPFQRRTPSTSYPAGSRFFRGAASLVGVAALSSAMRGIYSSRRAQPVSTETLEAEIVARTGEPGLVDAFHRFVFGYPDPSTAPRLWFQDDPGHTGADPWSGPFWDSPDLWIRHHDDGVEAHQPPEFGQDNWFYARVRNDADGGTCRHFVVTFAVKQFVGTEFTYPSDFLPCVAAVAGFDLAAGESTVVSARWPAAQVPPSGRHACLLASVQTRSDHPATSAHVWEHANLAQKNLSIVDLVPGDFALVPVVLHNPHAVRVVLEVWRDPESPQLEVGLVHHSAAFFTGRRPRLSPFAPRLEPALAHAALAEREGLMDCGGPLPGGPTDAGAVLTHHPAGQILRRFVGSVELPVAAGTVVKVPVHLPAAASTMVGFMSRMPSDAKPGEEFHTQLVQRDARSKRLLGGVSVLVRARDLGEAAVP
jgi:hypothetical protein